MTPSGYVCGQSVYAVGVSIGAAIGTGLTSAAIAVTAVVAGSGGGAPTGFSPASTQGEVNTYRLRWPPFPDAPEWSRPIPDDAATDPASDRYVSYLREALARASGKGPFLATGRYGVPIWVGRRGDRKVTLGACYRYRCPGVGGARVQLPRGARPDPGSDRHMVIVDARRQVAYDLFDARFENGRWAGAGGARVHLRKGDGSTGRAGGATAAHTALLAGLVRPVEIRRGRIDHALAVTIPGIGRGAPRCPARANVPTTSREDAPPEGTRFQLDPSLNLDALGLTRVELVVARALQRYGMIVVDNGGQVAFRGENYVGKSIDGWERIGLGRGDSISLGEIPLYRVRVISGRRC